MGEFEQSICDICKSIETVSRKYYYYNIECECCNNREDKHFEVVKYCSKCTPKPPYKISAVLKPLES